MKTLYTKKDIAKWWAELGNDVEARDDRNISLYLGYGINIEKVETSVGYSLILTNARWKTPLILKFHGKECFAIVGYYGNPYDNAKMEIRQ